MIQMPPNNIEFAQVVNTNNEVNLNTITNNLGSNSSNFLVVPTISQQSSSSSFFSNINNSITNSTSFNISTSSSQPNFNTLVNFSSPNSPQNSITSAASLHESDECELDLVQMDHAQIADDMGGVFDDIIKGSFDGTDLATSIPIMSSNNLNSSSVGATTSASVGFPTVNSIKQEMRYMNEDDACTTNSSSMSSNSNNEKLNHQMSTFPNMSNMNRVTTIVSNKNGKSVVEKRYGPIVVRPRRNPAPTLSSGRRSKYVALPAEEEAKRETRRQRNRQAAEKCKQKRTEIENQLERDLIRLQEMKRQLDSELDTLANQKAELEMRFKRHLDYCSQQQQFANNTTSYHNNSSFFHYANSNSTSNQAYNSFPYGTYQTTTANNNNNQNVTTTTNLLSYPTSNQTPYNQNPW